MIDPITIVGLAASVVQIVDTTGRLISKSIEIYQSSSGTSQENSELEKIVSDLRCTNAQLAKFPLQLGPGDVIDPDDKAIRDLCCGCNEVADELLGRLEKLKLVTGNDEPRKFNSFKYALKSVWTKKELDALYARVEAYKAQMQMRILVSLTERFDGIQLQQSSRFDSLERTGKDILEVMKHSRNLLVEDLGNQTEYLTKLHNAQHEEVLSKLSIIVESRSVSPCVEPYLGHDNKSGQSPRNSLGGLVSAEKSVARLGILVHDIVQRDDAAVLQQYLKMKPDAVFDVNEAGETPLHIAARSGNLNIARYLIRKGANKNADNTADQTPLHLAVQAGHTSLVRFLLVKGSDSDTEDNQGHKPLFYAEEGSEMQWVLSVGPGLEDKDYRGFTALRAFVRRGDLKTVQSLLDAGANIDGQGGQDNSTLIFEAAKEQSMDMLELLLTRGADIEARDSQGRTALSQAAFQGDASAVQRLLDHKADISAMNSDGYTPLHQACIYLRNDAAIELINRDTDLDLAVRDKGYTALGLAAMKGATLIMQHLLDHGADLQKGPTGWTPLHEASEHGHADSVHLLLSRGAKHGAKNSDGYTPLTLAARQGHVNVADELLDFGRADVNAPGISGWTALEEASLHGRLEFVKLLLSKGAIVDMVDFGGGSAIGHAIKYGHEEILELLRMHSSLQSKMKLIE